MYNNTLSANVATPKSTPLWLAIIISILLINLPGFFTALLGPIFMPALPLAMQHIFNLSVFLLCPVAVFGMLAQYQKINAAQCSALLGLSEKPSLQSCAIAGVSGVAVTLIGGVLAYLLGQHTEQSGLNLMASHTSLLGMISLFVMIVIASPLLEETVFRGWLWQLASQTRLGPFGAALVTSLIFTMLHITPSVQSVSLLSIFSIAMIAAWMRHHYHSLWPAIVLHSVFNACQFIGLLWITA